MEVNRRSPKLLQLWKIGTERHADICVCRALRPDHSRPSKQV